MYAKMPNPLSSNNFNVNFKFPCHCITFHHSQIPLQLVFAFPPMLLPGKFSFILLRIRQRIFGIRHPVASRRDLDVLHILLTVHWSSETIYGRVFRWERCDELNWESASG